MYFYSLKLNHCSKLCVISGCERISCCEMLSIACATYVLRILIWHEPFHAHTFTTLFEMCEIIWMIIDHVFVHTFKNGSNKKRKQSFFLFQCASARWKIRSKRLSLGWSIIFFFFFGQNRLIKRKHFKLFIH